MLAFDFSFAQVEKHFFVVELKLFVANVHALSISNVNV
jgi:hypothetical protein